MKAFRTGVQLPASPPKRENGHFSPFFLLEDCGVAPLVLCAECTLEPRDRAGIHSPVQAHLTHKAQEQLPRISKFMRGCTFGAVCKNAHLNPGTGLAFIRLCKHAHFSITARGRTYNSPHLHQKYMQNGIQEIVPILRFYCFLGGVFAHKILKIAQRCDITYNEVKI